MSLYILLLLYIGSVVSAENGSSDDYPGNYEDIQPYFDLTGRRNVSSVVGQTSYLRCTVRDLGYKTVCWIRMSDLLILTCGVITFTGDARFSSLHESLSDDWTLKIKYTQMRDQGEYQCHVNSDPKIIMPVTLIVEDPNPSSTLPPVSEDSFSSTLTPVSEDLFSQSSAFHSSHGSRAESPSPESVLVSLLITPFAKLGELLGLSSDQENVCQRELSSGTCAALYQEENCNGWNLEIPEGNLSFPYFSSYYKYRNAIQSVAVRVGCTLVGYDDSDFTDSTVTLLGESQWAPGQRDRYFLWSSNGNHPRCYHNPDRIYNLKNEKLNKDIEAVSCYCEEMSDFVCPWVNRDA